MESNQKIAAVTFPGKVAILFIVAAVYGCGPGSSLIALRGEDDEVCRIAECDRDFISQTSAIITLNSARGLLLKGKYGEFLDMLDSGTVKYLSGVAEKEKTTVQKILKRGYIHKKDKADDALVFLSRKGEISFRDIKNDYGARVTSVEASQSNGASMLFSVRFDGTAWKVSLLKEISIN